jgi:hypothetical protein
MRLLYSATYKATRRTSTIRYLKCCTIFHRCASSTYAVLLCRRKPMFFAQRHTYTCACGAACCRCPYGEQSRRLSGRAYPDASSVKRILVGLMSLCTCESPRSRTARGGTCKEPVRSIHRHGSLVLAFRSKCFCICALGEGALTATRRLLGAHTRSHRGPQC